MNTARKISYPPLPLLPAGAGVAPCPSRELALPSSIANNQFSITNSQSRKSFAAFTLIELLLAISIVSLVLAAMSGVLYVSFHLYNNVTDKVENALPIEQALTSIQHELANIICTPTAGSNTMLIGPFQTVNQTNVLPNQIGPDFYTTGGQPDGMVPWGDIEKIDYLLQPPTNRSFIGNDLVCATTRNLLQISGPPQPDMKRVVLNGVQNVTFTYYDGNNWQNTWDSTQQTNLPSAIKMQIMMASQNRGEVPKTYELVIPVSVQMSTNITGPIL